MPPHNTGFKVFLKRCTMLQFAVFWYSVGAQEDVFVAEETSVVFHVLLIPPKGRIAVAAIPLHVIDL